MLVVNHLPCALGFGSTEGERPLGMSLQPGNNTVEDGIWRLWSKGSQKCASLDWHIKEKHVEAFESVDFPALEEPAAVAAAKDTANLQLLRTWSDEEKSGDNRATVLAAIGERVESLEQTG